MPTRRSEATHIEGEQYISGPGKRRWRHNERVGGNRLGFRLKGHDLDRWIYVQRLQKVINLQAKYKSPVDNMIH